MSQLDISKQTRNIVTIQTKHPDGTRFEGIVLENKRLFVIIREMKDLEPDGVLIIPKKWIRKVRNGVHEQCVTEIVKSETNLDQFTDSKDYSSFDNLQAIITHLKSEAVWPAIEILYNSNVSVYIGPITEVSNESFKIYCYDSDGRWEKQYELEYQEVFKVEIDSRYTRHFNNYMRKIPIPDSESNTANL